VVLLDVDPGKDTNRTVVTLVGTPEGVEEAAFRAIKKASEIIDMQQHSGAHPRMGATDVCPFVPVAGVTTEDCIEISKKLGKRVGDELKIPVFLYEHSASTKERQNLANIRQGEFEGMAKKLEDPHWKPDFGPAKIHKNAGALATGAREFLIAYNIDLNTRDTQKAKELALTIREKGRRMRDENYQPVKDDEGNLIMTPGIFNHVEGDRLVYPGIWTGTNFNKSYQLQNCTSPSCVRQSSRDCI